MNREIVAMNAETETYQPSYTSSRSRASKSMDDPMRRFVPCAHTVNLSAAGRTLRLETNSPKLLKHMVELFGCYRAASDRSPQFLWRIVVESGSKCSPPWPRRSTFSDNAVRFAQFGQRNCLAVDLDAREAIGFVSEGLFEDAHGFTSPFVDTLFYMTSRALGLVPFAAACVCSGENGLLVLGGPNQGKTTASYLAVQGGLTFHADQSVFLEIVNDDLRAWSDFVPLAFRPETLHHLPELKSRTHAFSYCDFNFYYMRRAQICADQLGHTFPTCCIILERERSSVPRLHALAPSEVPGSLSAHIAFKEDRRFDEQEQKVLDALARLPVYRLSYDSDPATAAPFFWILLRKHGRLSTVKTAGH